MNAIDYIHDVLLIFISMGLYWLISYFRQKGRNAADLDDKRGLSYESKKGENYAIDEDKIYLEHKERLVRILYIAEKISLSRGKYVLYFYDNTNRSKFDALTESLNDLLADLYYEQSMAMMFLQQEEQQKVLETLVATAHGVIAELCTNSTNASSAITRYNQWMEYSRLSKERSNQFYLQEANKAKEELNQILAKKLLFAEPLGKSIEEYAKWLSEYLKIKINNIKSEDKNS